MNERRPGRLIHLIGGIATVSSLALPASVAVAPVAAQGAAQTWEVQVGGGEAVDSPFYEAQSFGPNPVIIHAGDTVKWTFDDVHTVTFLNGQPDLPLIGPGPKPGDLALSAGYFPAGPAPQNGVVNFDDSQVISSGVPQGVEQGQSATYSIKFSKPGIYGYICAVHPGMRGTVEVREASATLPETPAEAKVRGHVTQQAVASKAHAAVNQAMGVNQALNAGTYHFVWNGIGSGYDASGLLFAPDKITVKRGDTVVWGWGDPIEIHTVTFPTGANPPDFVTPQPQPNGPPQLVIPANVAQPQGGNIFKGDNSYVNSGVIPYGGTYSLKFDAPPGTYTYFCVIHPWMKGTVTVTG